jgi:peroxiredoxin
VVPVDRGPARQNNPVVTVVVGARPPSFRLPSSRGPAIGLEDYRERSHVLVWFTKGIACPFCRRQMVQIGKLYPRLRELSVEVLLVAPTRPDQALQYMRHFAVPYPYLCDPGYAVRRAWGLEVRRSAGAYVRMVRAARTLQQADVPEPEDVAIRPGLRDVPALLTDEDAGMFLVDREGVLRWGETGAYVDTAGGAPIIRPLPSDEEILDAVTALRGPARLGLE